MAFDGSGACIVGKLQMPGASAVIAIGTTPPTASNAGTGIWIDRGGLTSLVSSASQLKIDSSNGRLTTGSNSVVLDSNGITVIGTNKFRLFGTSSTCPTSPAATISMPYPAQYLEFTSTCGIVFNSRSTFESDLIVASAISLQYANNSINDYDSNSHTIGFYVPLTTPLTSTSWDGDARSTTAKTLIDLSTVFGVPPQIKAVLASVTVRDSSSASADVWMLLSPNNTAGAGVPISPAGLQDNALGRSQVVVPCSSNGDVYYQIQASGALTFDAWIEIWGYWI